MGDRNLLLEFLSSFDNGLVAAIAVVGIIIGAILFVKYNARVLSFIGKINTKLSAKITGGVGRHMQLANKKFKRTAELNINSLYFTIYRYFDEIIVNTGMHRSGVNVVGLLAFIAFLAIGTSVILAIVFNLGFLVFIAMIAFFYLYLVLFRYSALTKVERNEEIIMDCIDLLVSDVKSGIFNSIIKYKDSFHESVRPFFLECIDNVQNKGYSFAAAMDILTDKLGYTFSDFASKAVYYESKREEGSEGIFGSIIEMNRQRRILRRENAIAFNEIKSTLIISCIVIFGFGLYTGFTEPTIARILMQTMFGRAMIIFDIFLLTWVLNYITEIRAKTI